VTLDPLILSIIIGVAAFALGILLTWILMRQKQRIAVADSEAVLNSQIAEVSKALAAAETKNARLPELEMTAGTNAQEARAFREQHARATARIAALEMQLDQERKTAAEKLAVLDEAQTRFSDAFKALSSEALRHNNTSFLELAKSTLDKTQETAKGDLAQRQSAIDALVKPMRESLEKVDAKIHDLETARAGAYEALRTQVQSLAETQTHLRSETGNLVRALRAPHVRGRWGEIN
jgi:DNA recombination protein RmuC